MDTDARARSSSISPVSARLMRMWNCPIFFFVQEHRGEELLRLRGLAGGGEPEGYAQKQASRHN